MTRNTLIILIACVVALTSVAGSSLLLDPINVQREDLQLTFNPEVTKSLPPEVGIWYSALGSFRGLFVNILWMRATNLKEEGKFYEAKELSEMICQLQPRFPQVWSFHSWNMAYNISVATHTQRERWMWVNNGIELLRDKGIPLNPTSATLYRQLAWIFLHKIGQFSDDMHWYYKQRLAFEWQALLGEPPSGSKQESLDWFAPIAEMDRLYFADKELNPEIRLKIDSFIAQRPEAQPMIRDLRVMTPDAFDRQTAKLLANRIDDRDRELVEFVESLRAINQPDVGLVRVDPLAAFIGDYPEAAKLIDDLRSRGFELNADLLLRLGTSKMQLDAVELGYDFGPQFGSDPALQFLYTFLQDDGEAAARLRDELFLPFLRAKVLREHYRMNPTLMIDLMKGQWLATEEYPDPEPLPLDWRHPASHGLYWSALGVRAGQSLRKEDDSYYFEILNTDRQVLHALQALMHNGQIIFDPVGQYYEQLPDVRYIDGYEMAVYGAGSRIGGMYAKSTAIDSFEAGHENFLKWAISMLYFAGDVDEADRLYAKLAATYGHKPNRAVLYTLPIEEMIQRDFTENVTNLDDAKQVVSGLIRRAIIEGYVNGKPKIASQNMKMAKRIHTFYQNKQNRTTLNADRNRMGLRPWGVMVADSLTAFLRASPGQVPLMIKERAWQNIPAYNEDGSPNELKQRVWDLVREPLQSEVAQVRQRQPGTPPFERRFPKPPEMDAYRDANPVEAPR
jgi:hypothetical protein